MRMRYRFAGTRRRPVWPANPGFVALGADLAAGLRSDLRRWQTGPAGEARAELLLEATRRMAAQLGLGPCGGRFVDGPVNSGRKGLGVRRRSGVWTLELTRCLADDGGAAALAELVTAMLGAVQEVLREEWSEPPGGLVRRRGVDWKLVRSWSDARWRERDAAEATAAYLSGFRSKMRETATRAEPRTARLLMI